MPHSNPLRSGTAQEVDAALLGLSQTLVAFSSRVETFSPRSDETVAVARMLKRSSREIARLREAVPVRADLAAWSMRNLFELWVIFSSIVADPAQMRRWIAQTIADEIQVLEAVRAWTDDKPDRRAKLDEGIAELKRLCERLGLDPEARQFNIENLARTLNMLDEYKVMFKLSSKFVHPSAALVNERLGSDDAEYTNMFLIRSQEYAQQMLAEAKKWFELWTCPTPGDASSGNGR